MATLAGRATQVTSPDLDGITLAARPVVRRCVMKRSLTLALATVALATGSALAAPGDPRVVQGTLEWPQSLSTEPFVVIRGQDSRLYYADVSAAQRRSPGALTAGSPVAVLGIEGNRPFEVAALAFGPGDATSLGLTVPSAESTAGASGPFASPAVSPPSEPMWRLDGVVQSVYASTVTLRTDDGRTHAVDASQLSPGTVAGLRSGYRVTLFGVPRNDNKLVANGYIQAEPAEPAASPPSKP
jgi:hypothetical protein